MCDISDAGVAADFRMIETILLSMSETLARRETWTLYWIKRDWNDARNSDENFFILITGFPFRTILN